MTLRGFVAGAFFVVLLALAAPERGACQSASPATAASAGQFGPRADFEKHLRMLANLPPDPCLPRSVARPGDSEDHESSLFSDAAALVREGLNSTASGSESPRERTAAVLQELQETSAAINAAWPVESRFRFQILEVGPVLIVRVSMRTYDAFSAFARTDSSKSASLWRQIGSGPANGPQRYSSALLQLYPLYTGTTSGRVRFLAKLVNSGCAGSYAVQYDAWEWKSHGSDFLEPILSQGGAFGLAERVPGFEQIGSLRTEGPRITLPYCWFSAIDTWDNPSLCAVDIYDLSGAEVRFVSRTVNRPDLLPVAKAIEYAQKREYEAVRGYCESDTVARRLVHEVPPLIFAEAELKVTHRGRHMERVELGEDGGWYFDVAERSGRWVVVAFGGD